MDLHDVTTIVRPAARAALPTWEAGDALLAGGTWLFSEPQPGVARLVDLAAMAWADVEVMPAGLRLGATCTLRRLERIEIPTPWRAAEMLREAARSLAGSFKVTAAATVGGNLCLALPAAPMAAFAVALEATCEIWTADGGERRMAARDFLCGAGRTALGTGEVLRALLLPEAALRRAWAMRRAALAPYARSAALLVGTRDVGGFALTIAASVGAPVRLEFGAMPGADALAGAIDAAIPAGGWWDDTHGAPAWRRHMTLRLADEIRGDLAAA